ncbi:MAG TPA: SIMPL domain-containing protein [Gaiellaceae bacterium]|nr:SIMPL domain-containing protein [Gaiellaceae bacterium]
MKTRILPIAGLLTLAALLAAVSLPGPASSAAAESGGITVQGTASVVSVPDRAELSFGVESQGQTAKAALSANAAEMRRVIAAVKAAGGTELKTQSVSLSPRYNERNEVQAFVATNTVSATIKEIAKAGALIDAAVDAGANQVYGPSLSRGDQGELYRTALKAAVADARESAQALASASNLSLGRVTAIVEGGGAPQPMPFANADKAMEAGSTPIEPGTQQVNAVVSVTFSVS